MVNKKKTTKKKTVKHSPDPSISTSTSESEYSFDDFYDDFSWNTGDRSVIEFNLKIWKLSIIEVKILRKDK